MQRELYVLLAEKDENDCNFFKEVFKVIKAKTIINFFYDDHQVLDYLNKAHDEIPHIIFLDLNLPVMGGIECLTKIRANNSLNDRLKCPKI